MEAGHDGLLMDARLAFFFSRVGDGFKVSLTLGFQGPYSWVL